MNGEDINKATAQPSFRNCFFYDEERKTKQNKTENTWERTKAEHNQQWMDVYKLCDFFSLALIR